MTNIKNLRLNKGNTQQQLADFLGITRGAYSNIENGKREPDISTLIRLSDYFCVTIDHLVNHIGKGENRMNTIGLRIRNTREANKYTIEAFSDILNISPDQLLRFEADQEKPSENVLSKISNKFGHHDWLLNKWEKDVQKEYNEVRDDDARLSIFKANGVPFDMTSDYLSLMRRLNPSIEEKELEELGSKIEATFGVGTVELLRDYASMNATGKAEVRKYAHTLTFDPAHKKEEQELKRA